VPVKLHNMVDGLPVGGEPSDWDLPERTYDTFAVEAPGCLMPFFS
jgi:hypothetical protein